jgi:hypothetical protein
MGIASGALMGIRGLLVPIVAGIAWLVERGLAAGFEVNGDNVAAERALSATAGMLIGFLGVALGLSLRAVVRRSRRRGFVGPERSD